MYAKVDDRNVVVCLFVACLCLMGIARSDVALNHGASAVRVTAPASTTWGTEVGRPSLIVIARDREILRVHPGPGVQTISRQWFAELGLGVMEFVPSQARSQSAFSQQLSRAFPSSIVGRNEQIIPLGTTLEIDITGSSHSSGNVRCNSTERIGIIDGRINADHPALADHVIVEKSFLPQDAEQVDAAHGNGVLSVLVDTYARASSGPLDILAAEVLERRHDGVAGSLLATVKALDWLVGEGATVINMSFQVRENRVFSEILDRVAASGVIMVAAAGNNELGDEWSFPAAHPNVLSVTAIDALDNAAPFAHRGDHIDFAAPGWDVPVATADGMGRASGTSYAAPYVTGVIALALQSGAPRDLPSLERLLSRTAHDLGNPGKDPVYGWGVPEIGPSCGLIEYTSR